MSKRIVNRSDIRRAMDQCLPHLEDRPDFDCVVLRRIRGTRTARKKWSVGIVAAIILVLAAATALAVSLTRYFNSFATLEHTYGEFQHWPQETKVEFVNLMQENNLQLDQTLLSEMNTVNSIDDASRIAEEIIELYFGNDSSIDTYNVMLHELGQFMSWPQEYKALYSSLLISYGKQKEDWPIYLTPSENDIQQEEAVSKSIEILDEKFSVEDWLSVSHVQTAFFRSPSEYGEHPVWLIEFSHPTLYADCFRVTMTNTGEILSFKAPQSIAYLLDSDNILKNATFVVPGSHDLSYDQIILAAKQSIQEIGDLEISMDCLDVQAYFLYHDNFNYGYEPVWLVYFFKDEQFVYQMLFGYEGSFISGSYAGQEFDRVHRDIDGIGVDFWDTNFTKMTIEEKAAFSATWNPIIEAYIQENPYFKNYNGMWYQVTRHVYGIPEDKDLSQEKATQIAIEELIALGVDQSTVDTRRISYTFDITDVQHPLWKLLIYHVPFDSLPEHPSTTDTLSYQVILDAQTGEVLHVYNLYQEEFDGLNL